MATSTRPGQVRFEAWLPEDLYREFSAVIPNRKAWLLDAVRREVRREARRRGPSSDLSVTDEFADFTEGETG